MGLSFQILSSVPAISLFIFSRCRIMTISGIAIAAVIPGLSTIYEVENAARASYTRQLAMMPADKQWLTRITEDRWAALPKEYAWLRDWELV